MLALLISLVLLHQNAQRVLVIDRCHGIVQFLVVLLLHRQHLLRIFSMTIIASRFPDSGVIVSIATSRVIRVIRGAEAGVRRETLFFRGVSVVLVATMMTMVVGVATMTILATAISMRL